MFGVRERLRTGQPIRVITRSSSSGSPRHAVCGCGADRVEPGQVLGEATGGPAHQPAAGGDHHERVRSRAGRGPPARRRAPGPRRARRAGSRRRRGRRRRGRRGWRRRRGRAGAAGRPGCCASWRRAPPVVAPRRPRRRRTTGRGGPGRPRPPRRCSRRPRRISPTQPGPTSVSASVESTQVPGAGAEPGGQPAAHGPVPDLPDRDGVLVGGHVGPEACCVAAQHRAGARRRWCRCTGARPPRRRTRPTRPRRRARSSDAQTPRRVSPIASCSSRAGTTTTTWVTRRAARWSSACRPSASRVRSRWCWRT